MSIKSIIAAPVRLLNVPEVKQGVKNCIGVLTCAAGVIAANSLIRHPSTTEVKEGDDLYSKCYRVSIIGAKLCLVLSALTSAPAIKMFSAITAPISEATLSKCFGPNTIFAINPLHPRHLVSLAGPILGISSLALTVFAKIKLPQQPPVNESKWYEVTDKKVITLCGLVLLTSRPVLHGVNQFLSARI